MWRVNPPGCNAGKLLHFMHGDFWILFRGSSLTQRWAKIDSRGCGNFRCVVPVYAQHIFQYDHFRGRVYVHAKFLKVKIPFQTFFYPFKFMFKIMKGYKIFAFTPSGKSLRKTLLPAYVVESATTNIFKNKLDSYWSEKGYGVKRLESTFYPSTCNCNFTGSGLLCFYWLMAGEYHAIYSYD